MRIETAELNSNAKHSTKKNELLESTKQAFATLARIDDLTVTPSLQ
jgi:hypothetical protein